MTTIDARRALRRLGRAPLLLTSGRYKVPGVAGTVRACDLRTIAEAFVLMEEEACPRH